MTPISDGLIPAIQDYYNRVENPDIESDASTLIRWFVTSICRDYDVAELPEEKIYRSAIWTLKVIDTYYSQQQVLEDDEFLWPLFSAVIGQFERYGFADDFLKKHYRAEALNNLFYNLIGSEIEAAKGDRIECSYRCHRFFDFLASTGRLKSFRRYLGTRPVDWLSDLVIEIVSGFEQQVFDLFSRAIDSDRTAAPEESTGFMDAYANYWKPVLEYFGDAGIFSTFDDFSGVDEADYTLFLDVDKQKVSLNQYLYISMILLLYNGLTRPAGAAPRQTMDSRVLIKTGMALLLRLIQLKAIGCIAYLPIGTSNPKTAPFVMNSVKKLLAGCRRWFDNYKALIIKAASDSQDVKEIFRRLDKFFTIRSRHVEYLNRHWNANLEKLQAMINESIAAIADLDLKENNLRIDPRQALLIASNLCSKTDRHFGMNIFPFPLFSEETDGTIRIDMLRKWSSTASSYPDSSGVNLLCNGGFLVGFGRALIAVDPGCGFLQNYRLFQTKEILQITAVVLTHFHPDHCGDLQKIVDHFYNERKRSSDMRPLKIFLPSPKGEPAGDKYKYSLKRWLGQYGNEVVQIYYYFDERPIDIPSYLSRHKITLYPMKVIHNKNGDRDAFSLVMELKYQDHESFRIAFSGDLRYEPAVANHLKKANLAILNVGGVKMDEILDPDDRGYLRSQHLNTNGTISMLTELKDIPVFLSEFYEPLSIWEYRLPLLDHVKAQSGHKNAYIAETGDQLLIEGNQIRAWCSPICGNPADRSMYVPLSAFAGQAKTTSGKAGSIHLFCQNCESIKSVLI